MLDAPRDPASVDARFPNGKDYSWDALRAQIFGPVENWPPGPLHSVENIRAKADALVEMFEGLATIQISSNEIHDIQVFINGFDDYLCVLEIGPGPPHTNVSTHTRLFRARRSASPVVSHEQLAHEFVTATRSALIELKYQCAAITEETELSRLAFDSTPQGRIPQNHLRSKMSIALSHGTGLGDHVETLARIAGRDFIRSAPKPPRGVPSIVEDHITEVALRALGPLRTAS